MGCLTCKYFYCSQYDKLFIKTCKICVDKSMYKFDKLTSRQLQLRRSY